MSTGAAHAGAEGALTGMWALLALSCTELGTQKYLISVYLTTPYHRDRPPRLRSCCSMLGTINIRYATSNLATYAFVRQLMAHALPCTGSMIENVYTHTQVCSYHGQRPPPAPRDPPAGPPEKPPAKKESVLLQASRARFCSHLPAC